MTVFLSNIQDTSTVNAHGELNKQFNCFFATVVINVSEFTCSEVELFLLNVSIQFSYSITNFINKQKCT